MTDTSRPLAPPPQAGASPTDPRLPSENGLSLPRLSGPGWLAATGATLLLVAAVVVVAGQWSVIGPTARFAGLVGALFAGYFAAEASRSRIPTTATWLAVLAACVTAPVGIAAVAALEGRWPLCITVGGAAALLACELQSRRWTVRTLKAATVVATGLLVAGASVLLDVPAALLGAGAAAVALALGASRRSFVLAVLVPVVPALWILADWGVGPGVLARMGVVGGPDWVIPVSTAVAGSTLAASAHRSGRSDTAATALVVLAYSGASALIETLPAVSIWLSVPGAVALAVATVAMGGDRSIFSRWACDVRTPIAVALAGASCIAPIAMVVARTFASTADLSLGSTLVLPAFVTLASLVALSGTVDRTAVLDDVLRFGCVGAVVAAVAATDVPMLWVAIAALCSWFVTTATTSWRVWIATSSLHAIWSFVALAGADADAWAESAVVVAAASIVVLACCSWRETTAAAAIVPIPVAVGLLHLGALWSGDRAVLGALVAVVAVTATGLAMLRPDFTPPDSLALSLGVGAAAIGALSGPAGVSLAITLLAAQIWIYGVAFRRLAIATDAAAVAVAGLVSLWWTTGSNDLVIDAIAPYGATGQDLALGAAAAALLGGGVALRRVQQPSTWLAYSPGLGLAFAWLLVAQLGDDADWATFAGLVVGVLAVGIGGARRLAAPLVIGTFGLVASGVISIGARLASAPTWTWIAIGGFALLCLAAMLERSERPLLPARPASAGSADRDTPSAESLIEAFTRTFR